MNKKNSLMQVKFLRKILMKKLQNEKGTAIIFITHDLGVVAQISDQVIVMYKGEIVERGLVSEIYNHPKHPYTRGLLACKPPINLKLRELPTRKHFLERDKDGFLGDFVGYFFFILEIGSNVEKMAQKMASRDSVTKMTCFQFLFWVFVQ